MAGNLFACICCSVCILVVTTIGFIILSFSSLPVNTYGLDYSPITKEINLKVFESGYHYIGFMHKFLEYPTTYQTFSFSDEAGSQRGPVNARSKDGLMVNFRAQFQYQLQMGSLIKLYTKYGDDYQRPCIRFAVDTMNDVASKHSAAMFFRNLTTVNFVM